jgi:hypothetical protein
MRAGRTRIATPSASKPTSTALAAAAMAQPGDDSVIGLWRARLKGRAVEHAELNKSDELNLRWLVGTAVAGALIVGSAVAISISSNWNVVWSSLLLEVGASIMLVSAVFLAERRFVGRAKQEIIRVLSSPIGMCERDVPYAPLHLFLTPEGDVVYRCSHEPAHAVSSDELRRSTTPR